jgi:hypothetical protein
MKKKELQKQKGQMYYSPKLKGSQFKPVKTYPSSHQHYYTTSYVRPYYYQNVYYPFYSFYWWNYNLFSPYFSPYFSYYLSHGFPYYYYDGPLVLFSGQRFVLSDNVYNLSSISPKLRQCSKGPEYYFSVRVSGKVYRIFLGDVNDYFNVQCLYMMNAVISVGDVDYAEKVYEIFNNPSKTINANGKSITINPFRKAKYVPSNVKIDDISSNMKEMTFKLKNFSLPSKKVVFYHKDNVGKNDYEDIFRELSHEVPSGNVLFIIDQFQKQSVNVFRHYLVRYRRFTPSRLVRLRYKNYYIFPRHHHHTIIRKH